jgi:hypothetical protein
MEMISAVMIGVLGLGIPALVIAGTVYLVSRLRGGQPIRVQFRAIVRVYVYAVILVGIGLTVLGGVSNLIKVGFGEAFGKEFSYREAYDQYKYSRPPYAPEPAREPAANGDNTSIPAKPTPVEPATVEPALEQRVDRAREGTVINGASLMIIGALIWIVHALGRRRLETEEERDDILNRAYLIASLLMFTIAAIVSLVTGIPETLRYFFLDSLDRHESPGGPLAVAVVAFPIWVYYLVLTLRTTIRS